MHPITQSILALGVLALVGMGGYALVYGLPKAEREASAIDRLRSSTAAAGDTLCQRNLARDWSELNREGRADRVRCLAD